MKDGRRITLKNPHLIILRNNLRELFDKAYNEERNKLYTKISQIEETRRNKKDNQIKAQMRIEIENLRKKNNQLEDTYHKSILRCGLCNTLKGDRIYYKRFDEWYCPKCFEKNKNHWPPLNWEPQYPISKERVFEFLYNLKKVAGQCQTNLDLSKEILTRMGVEKRDQDTLLKTLYYYDGHCDCEILMNAYQFILDDFNLNEDDAHYLFMKAENIEYERQIRKRREEKFGVTLPTWPQLRSKIKEWGGLMISRYSVGLLLRILAEKKITEESYEEYLHPIVEASLKYCEIIGKKRLTIDMIVHVIKDKFPEILKLEFFQEESLKEEIKRGINVMLDKEEELPLDLEPRSIFPIIPKLDNGDELMDFFISNLPHTFEGEELNKDYPRYDRFAELYKEINDFLEAHESESQLIKFKEKLKLFREIQGEKVDWYFD